KLMAKRAARPASRPAPPPIAGPGWRVTAAPGNASHEELERFAFQVFDLAFHAIPRPQWRVRWGEVDHYDPENPLSYALACADTNAKIIIVDRRYYAHRSTEDLIETIFHEWTHVMHPGESHGEKFQKTLASVRAYLNDLKQHPTPRAPIVERPGYLPSRPV